MLENTNTKQFYPGPILNKTLEITKFLFRNPEQVKLQKTALDEDGNAYNVDLVYGTDYEVQKVLPNDINIEDANLTASTGQITLKNTVEVLEGEKLTAYRESALIQDVDYPRTGKFPAASHEGALDYLTMQNQEQQDQIDRSLKVPVSTQNFNGALPVPEPAKALKINADGSGFELSEYDPDMALETTKEYMQGAQTAANAALASQSAAASSAQNAATSATNAQGIVTAGQTSINNTVSAGEAAISESVEDGKEAIQQSVDSLKSYLNANPFSGKSIGEFFWTFRKDEINGAYDCNGQEFLASTFSGDNNPYDLLVAGKLPVKTYEEYQQELTANSGVCGYFGLDTVNQKFKLPIVKEIYIQASNIDVIGQFIAESLPNIKGDVNNGGYTFRHDVRSSGAFSTSGSVNYYPGAANGAGIPTLSFNASLSSSVYQDNAPVLPNSIKLRPMVQLASAATEVSFADYATQFTAALNQAINSLTATGQAYLQELTPNQFVKFSNRRRIKIAANTFLRLDVASTNQTLWYVNLEEQEIEAESLLDEGSTFQAGKNYTLYLVPNAAGTGVELKVSLNQTAPTGYSPLDTRRIAGWHTECRDVGDVTWYTGHPLSGWLAGDILPQSVWTIYHRPYASPLGTIYIPCGIPFWRTIYDHAGTLATTSFEYGGTVTRSRSFYGHMQDMMHAGYIMPTYEQAAISGVGCEPLKAVLGKAEASVTTAGGHLNESNHRITSIYGAEDCVGCTWKLTTIGAIGGSNWATDPSVGVHQYGSVNVLLVGGNWGDSGPAGPFASDGSTSALTAYSSTASFGVSYPLPRKSEGNV